MQRVQLLVFVLLLGCQGAGAAKLARRGDVHPVEKVINLLKDLSKDVKEEGQEEEISYQKFEEWCRNSISDLEKAVAKEKEEIDSLESEVEAKKTEEEMLDKHIGELKEELEKHEQAATDSKKEREDAQKLYEDADKDLEDSIKAVGDAVKALKDAEKETTKGGSLVQAKLQALLQLPLMLEQLSPEQLTLLAGGRGEGPPTPRADILARGDLDEKTEKYSFKSDNVIDLLKELKVKFEDDRREATKEETNAQHAYDLAKNARDAAIEAAEEAQKEKEKRLGDVRSELEEAEGTLKDVKADLKADSEALGSTEKSCMMKKTEWEERTKIREGEMKALEMGVKILAKVTGVRTEKPENPSLPTSPLEEEEGGAALLQGGVALLQVDDPRARAVNLLREEAREVHSKSFARFAEEVAASMTGPFEQVNNMIQKMVFRLMAEQRDEDDHKNWCDLEIQKTNSSRENKEDKIKVTEAKLEDAKATVDDLAKDIVNADKMAARLEEHLKEAAEVRQAGKEENAKAVKDAKAAQAAIARAESVILDFYKDSGMVEKKSWELLQREPVELPEEPSTWDSSYTGVSDPKKQPDGIITVLKEVSADFATMEAETKAQEETDAKAYEEEVTTTEIERSRRAKESEVKAQEKKRLLEKIDSMEKSLKHVNSELDAVKQYYSDLGPACMEGDSTYEERKEAREKEIEALKEAQEIFADYKNREVEKDEGSFLAIGKRAKFLSRK